MDLLDLDVLPLFVILVVPGFIAAKVYDLSVPGERRNWASDFLEVLVYGALNFGLWFWLIDFLVERRAEMVWGFRVGMGFVLLVSPIFLGAGTSLLLRWRGLRGFVRHPTPTAWDHFFQRRKECWVLCNLRNGQRVGGFYRQGSFAGASQNGRDLYIREVWRVSERGKFLRPVEGTLGVVLSMEDCISLEFLEVNDDRQAQGTRQ